MYTCWIIGRCATPIVLTPSGWRVPTSRFCGRFWSSGFAPSVSLRYALRWLCRCAIFFMRIGWGESLLVLTRSISSYIKSKYKTAKGKPKVAQQGTVQGAEPYYVRMGVAWLLATALAKFPDQTRAFVRSSNLPEDVVKLYIRKTRESLRTRTVKTL